MQLRTILRTTPSDGATRRHAPLLLLALSPLAPGAATADVATATVDVYGNPQRYEVTFDEQSGEYQDVEMVKGQTSQLDDPVEAHVQFGGTCEPGSDLLRSELKLIPSQHNTPDLTHEWSGENNYDNAFAAVGGSSTQHFKARDACSDGRQGRAANEQGIIEAFTLWQVPLHQVEHKLVCSGNHTSTALATANYLVSCGESPAPPSSVGAQSLSGKFTVTNADIAVNPSNATGACPVDVTLTMSVESTGSGTAQLVVETPEGGVSQPYSVTTKRQGNKYVGTVNQTFSVPEPDDTPSGPQLTTGGFSPPATPQPGEGPQVAATPIPPGHHSGSFRVKVKFPTQLTSDWAQYTVNCQTSGVASGGGFTQPATPTHGGPSTDTTTQGVAMPRDVASGLPTGRRQHEPITIRKEIDKSTPTAPPPPPQRTPMRSTPPGETDETRHQGPITLETNADRTSPTAAPPPSPAPARSNPAGNTDETRRDGPLTPKTEADKASPMVSPPPRQAPARSATDEKEEDEPRRR